MTGLGSTYGTITILNPIPCGIGAALSVDLPTTVEFSEGASSEIDPVLDSCVRSVLKSIGEDPSIDFGLKISTEIPSAMESICPISMAAMLAVLDEYDSDMDVVELCRIYSKCSIKGKASITGSFSEACASSMKGLYVTDEDRCKILHSEKMEGYDVLLCIPRNVNSSHVDPEQYYRKCEEFESLSKIAIKDPFNAMTESGRMVSSICGANRQSIDLAIENGAFGAGVCGTSPTIAIVIEEGFDFIPEMNDCEIIRTNTVF